MGVNLYVSIQLVGEIIAGLKVQETY